jgi:hypothetical protein
MEFVAMRQLSRELPIVLTHLQRDGELVVTNNGQPTILMINLVGKDMVEVISDFRKQQKEKSLAQKQNEALKRLYDGLKTIDDEPFDEQFDAIMAKRVNFTRELDL